MEYKSQLKGQNGLLFRSWWKKQPEQPENLVRVFIRDALGHFTLHGKDTKYISEILNIQNVIKKGSSDINTTGMDWAMVNLVQLRSLLRELIIIRGFRVEIFERGENDWEGISGSPGNLSCIENYVFDANGNDLAVPSCRVLALVLSKTGPNENFYSYALVDAETREALVNTIQDDGRYSQLESILVQFQVREVLISSDPKEQLISAVKRCSSLLSTIHKNHFILPGSDEVNSIFAKGCAPSEDAQLKCVGAAVKYLDLGRNTQFKAKSLEISRYAKLDASIFENLHLCSLKETSLFSILSASCQTTQGARLLRKWITQPLLDKTAINDRQEIVSVLVENDELRNRLSKIELKRMPDISKLALKFHQFSNKTAKYTTTVVLKSLIRMNEVCKRLPILIELFKPIDNLTVQSVILEPITMLDAKIQKLVMLIETHVAVGARICIKKGIDGDLDEIQNKLEEIDEEIRDSVVNVADDLQCSAKEVKIDQSSDGVSYRVVNKFDKILTKCKTYERLSTTKTGITFTNSTLRELSDRWQESSQEYEDHAKLIVDKMISIVTGYAKYLVQLGEITGRIDALTGMSCAAVSSTEPWCRPEFTDERKIELEELRHPILDFKNVEVVPNDVFLEENKRFMILTGPNMGGKTTYLRATAVAAILAQIGSYVPASTATLPIFDAIIARIGAGDNIQRGVSTFLHEMIETETIFRQATEKSFVIIDELGRGTSTWDGFAFAIAESLVSKTKCLGMFATHYHEMAALSSKCPQAFNMHTSVFVNEEKVTHLYKVEPGSCSKSYGIEIAKLAGFDENILERANELNKETEECEKVIGVSYEISDREDAIKVLKEILKLPRENPNFKTEILKMVSAANNPILNAAV